MLLRNSGSKDMVKFKNRCPDSPDVSHILCAMIDFYAIFSSPEIAAVKILDIWTAISYSTSTFKPEVLTVRALLFYWMVYTVKI